MPVARYTLRIPDFNIDFGEFVEVTVNAECEAQARQLASELEPGYARDLADCVRMRNGDRGSQ